MITDKEFLETELKMGISFDNALFVSLAKHTAQQFKDLPIKSVLDYGAGTGVYSDAFYQEGYDVRVFEIWNAHKKYIKEKAPHLKFCNKPFSTDLMAFIEVAEHMTDQQLFELFEKIKPTYILFSSTSVSNPEFDLQWGHINLKQQAEWDIFFDKLGYNILRQVSYPTNYSKIYVSKSI